jgi:hypothetical protein
MTGPQNATLFWPETASWGVTYLGAFQGRVNGRIGAGQTNNNLLYTRPSNIGGGYTRTSLLHDGPTGTDVLYVNGSAVLTQTGKLSTIRQVQNTLWLGQGLSSTYFNGDIVEVLVYTRTLGAAERQQVETYLRRRRSRRTRHPHHPLYVRRAASADRDPARRRESILSLHG